ncbi:hypothetical protein QFZ49_007505 [Streptomyces turgidiscabies]|uniref:Glycosyl hydrolase family 92 N-terminal domain-containing protein n=1 Tax=Streptomyces turgidiscabies TaxID=85558 RepID=A0ABU0S2X6_9ACTN|nr:hypothetical protein [Streptomyces turgidiscabies]
MRVRPTSLLLAAALALAAPIPTPVAAAPRNPLVPDPTPYVDPLIGTRNGGDVFPGAVVPFGMLSWSPENTRGDATRTAAPGGYHYDATRIRGFSLTHMSGTGCAGGSGDIPFFPYAGAVTSSPASDTEDAVYAADFSHAEETAEPGHYRVSMTSGVTADLTATTRTGSARFTYPPDRPASMLIRTANSEVGSTDSTVTIDPVARTVSGSVTSGNFCGHLDPETRRPYYTLHNNEPSVNVPYLYAYAGAPHKTQETVPAAMTRLWSTRPGGIPGNDDLGAMSSWYVFAALGMYPGAVPSRTGAALTPVPEDRDQPPLRQRHLDPRTGSGGGHPVRPVPRGQRPDERTPVAPCVVRPARRHPGPHPRRHPEPHLGHRSVRRPTVLPGGRAASPDRRRPHHGDARTGRQRGGGHPGTVHDGWRNASPGGALRASSPAGTRRKRARSDASGCVPRDPESESR